MIENWSDIVLLLKYALAIAIVFTIIMAPAYLARQAKKEKQDMIFVRLGSWVMSWSGIAWLIALFWAVKK